MLLALDINSKSVGVAFGGADAPAPRCITWRLYGCADDESLTRSCAALYNSISEVGKLLHPVVVAIEAPFNPQGGGSNHSTVIGMFSLAAIARAAGANSGAKILVGHVQTWRKHFTGSGRPENPKKATLARCELLGWKVTNDDEGDAAGLWCWAMSTQFPKWSPNGTALFSPNRRAGGAP